MSQIARGRASDRMSALVERNAAAVAAAMARNRLIFEARDREGRLLWRDEAYNLVVNEGLNDTLAKYFTGAAYTAAWYCGLTSATPSPAPGDTMAVHPGWTEIQAYDEPTRPQVVFGAASGQAINNFASPAVFTINAPVTVGGGFTVFNNVKGGTTGPLYNVVAFSEGDKPLAASDTLTVRCVYTQASA